MQAKIIEYDSFVLKPAQMLIQLRRVADNLPTKTQLSNFLNFHRNKIESIGSSSTQIALNDYKAMHENHKNVPDNVDELFIPDVYVNALIENGKLMTEFRIFFTTKSSFFH